jgi:hypothetical protein
LLPSQKIAVDRLSHSSEVQRLVLFTVLDKYPECVSHKPSYCPILEHEINVTSDFRPKRLPAYRVPENLKAGVDLQIRRLLGQGVIRPSDVR